MLLEPRYYLPQLCFSHSSHLRTIGGTMTEDARINIMLERHEGGGSAWVQLPSEVADDNTKWFCIWSTARGNIGCALFLTPDEVRGHEHVHVATVTIPAEWLE
jgi:hypothetical protein